MMYHVAALMVTLLPMFMRGEAVDTTPMDGCPSILQESVYSTGFYSKSLPSSAYFAFQDTVCSLQMDASKDIVLPLVGASLESFIQAAQVLVSKWSPIMEAAVRADTSLDGKNTQVAYIYGLNLIK